MQQRFLSFLEFDQQYRQSHKNAYPAKCSDETIVNCGHRHRPPPS